MNVERDSVCPYTSFQLSSEDALYGLGQFRDNKMNLRNTERELVQFNTQAAILWFILLWGGVSIGTTLRVPYIEMENKG